MLRLSGGRRPRQAETTPAPDPGGAEPSQEPVDPSREAQEAEPAGAVVPCPRQLSAWDVAGLCWLGFLALGVTAAMPRWYDAAFHRSPVVDGLTWVAGLVAVGSAAWIAVKQHVAPSAIPVRLTAIWRDPPGDWPAFPLGLALAAPALGLYSPTLFTDADSMRLVSAVRYVQRGHLDFLVETQDSFGPHLFLGPAVASGSVEALRLLTIFSMMALAGVVAWVTRKLSGSMAGAAVAALAVLAIPPAVGQVLYLPMYTAMLAFASLGSWLAYRAIGQDGGWRHALAAGLCLVAAQEAQLVGQLFLAVPLILLVTAPELRRGLAGLGRVYTAVVLFLLPRIVVNLSDGGLAHFRTNRTDYWITEGYLREIQTEFRGYEGLGESYLTYLQRFPERFVTSLGDFGWVVLVLAAVALVGLRGRARWAALGFLTLIVAAMTVTTIQPAARYYAPLWPGVALLAGLAAAWLARRRHLALRAVALLIAVPLIWVSALTLRDAAQRAERLAEQVDRHYSELADAIDDGKGVVGARSHALVAADMTIPAYGGQFLSEEEFATYLTWPSDEEVVAVMDRHDIGWVLIRTHRAIEKDYHDTWLVPHHGREARHLEMVKASPNFCEAHRGPSAILYKQAPCD